MNDDPGSSKSRNSAIELDVNLSANLNERAESDSSIANAVGGFVRRLVGSRNGEDAVREAIEELIEEQPEAATEIESEERNLLANILALRDQTVADVMVPRADIIAIDVTASLNDLVDLINREAHSRIPIYQDNLDDAIGMVHIKDVLVARQNMDSNAAERLNLKNILRDVIFVSPSMQVLELLLEMRVKRTHMALVVDEYGGVDGLLTIEDLVEEIVGEIEDEHDQNEEPVLVRLDDGAIDADARVSIESFEETTGPILTDEEREEVETLGGLVFSLIGRVPIRGELVKHSTGMELEILDADPRRVKRLRVRFEPVSGTEH